MTRRERSILLAVREAAMNRMFLLSGAVEGQPPPTVLREIIQLQRSVESLDRLTKQPSTITKISVWLTAAVAIVLLVLFSIRVPSAEIVLDVTASELSFVVNEARLIRTPIALATLSLVGAYHIMGPPDVEDQLPASKALSMLFLSTATAGSEHPSQAITLTSWVIQSGTRVSLARQDEPRSVTIKLYSQNPIVLDVTVPKNAQLLLDTGKTVLVNRTWPLQIRAAQGQPIELALTLMPGPDQLFEDQLSVAELGLSRIVDDPASPIGSRSTITSGTLSVVSPGGQEHKLNRREFVSTVFDHSLVGSFSLTAGGQLAADISGTVTAISSGMPGAMVNRKPRVIEWLKDSQGVALLWSSIAYFAILITGVVKWLHGRS
jgi:hypothetical protein